MVEFDVVNHSDLWQVVHEFRLLVEVGGVVFVTLDDKVWTVSHAKAGVEILYDPADEKARVKAADLANPRRETRRRGLAVRAGDHQRTAATNELFFYHL